MAAAGDDSPRRVRPRCDDGSGGSSGGDGSGNNAVAGDAAVPLLVVLLAGNPATAAAIMGCIISKDTRALRRLHPAVAATVAGVPWNDGMARIMDVVRWRAALPAAVSAWLGRLPSQREQVAAAVAALQGVTHLDLRMCSGTTDAMLLRLPRSLRDLNVSGIMKGGSRLTDDASFLHLACLETLDCSFTAVLKDVGAGRLPRSLRQLCIDSCEVAATASFRHLRSLRELSCQQAPLSRATIATLPPTLEELDVSFMRSYLSAGVSLAHLTQLRVLRATYSTLDNATLAALPPSLQVLELGACDNMTRAATFAHLGSLKFLGVNRTTCFGKASLDSLPPSLESLSAQGCEGLTHASVLPHLPALRELDVSNNSIGAPLVASLPPSLVKLRINSCYRLDGELISLDHLPLLRELQHAHTSLPPAVLAACRARGCVVLDVVPKEE